jgi:hypothetical protein
MCGGHTGIFKTGLTCDGILSIVPGKIPTLPALWLAGFLIPDMREDRTTLAARLRAFPRPVWILFVGTFLNKFGAFVIPFLALYMTRSALMAWAIWSLQLWVDILPTRLDGATPSCFRCSRVRLP